MKIFLTRHAPLLFAAALTSRDSVAAVAAPRAFLTVPSLGPGPAMPSDAIFVETLPNGVRSIYQGRPGCGTYALAVAALGGGFEDPDEHLGLTSVLAEMLLRGTASRSAAEQARQVEATGSSLEASGSVTAIELQAVGPAKAFGEVFDLMAEAALRPRLDPNDLRKEIALEQQSLRISLDNPSSELMRAARPVIFPGHRLGRVPDPKTYLTSLGIEPIRDARARRFVGRRLVVVIVGEVDQAEARRRVAAAFSDLPPGEAAPLPFPSPKPLTVEPRARARRRTSQPELLLAMPTAGIEDADEPAMELLSQILGGFQERLSTEIREKRGWAYWIGVMEWRFPGMGLFGVRTAVPKKRLAEAEAIIRDELQRIATEAPAPEEVDRARRFTLTELARSWQQSATRAAFFASSVIRGHPPRSYDEQAARLEAVTPEAIRDLARRLMTSSRMGVVTLY